MPEPRGGGSRMEAVRVLAVDDEDAELIVDKLNGDPGEPRLEAVGATGAEEALRLLAEAPDDFDVLVVDMRMPHPLPDGDPMATGLWLLGEVRQRYPLLTAIVLTAQGSSANTVAAMEQGAFSYVDKDDDGWRILPIKVRLAATMKAQSILVEATGGLVHDIQQPLTEIRLLADIPAAVWAKMGLDQTQMILAQCARMAAMIRALLSAIRGRPPALNPLPCAVDEWLSTVAPLLGILCYGHKVQFAWDSRASGQALLDAARVESVLENLVVNGARAAEERNPFEGGQVLLVAELEADELVIRVSDNGAGVPEELLPVLFGSVPPNRLKGNGWGLLASRQTAEQHGGRLEAANLDGGGALFILRLPLTGPASAETAGAEAEAGT